MAAGFAVGVVLSMHTRASLERFGAEAMIPAGLAIALIRETGSLVTGLLVAGRVGAGIGASTAMPLGSDSPSSPEGLRWDGVALAVILPKDTRPRRR